MIKFFKKDYTDKDLDTLCFRCCDHLRKVMEKTDFGGFSVHFDNIVHNWHIGKCGLRVVKSYKGDGFFALEIYATYPDGSGYEIKNILLQDKKDNIKEYLAREEMKNEMIKTFEHFSDKIADKI